MTVSVIIPNYNHASYLVQRIESVLNQTYQDFEVIILDDCSTDNSLEIIELYRNHPKVSQIVYNDVNCGSTFKQWLKGIELALGEWIWIAESDDWCERNFLEVVLPVNSEDVVLSYCGSLMYDADKIISYPDIRKLDEIIDGHTFCKNRLVQGNAILNASMCVFRKSVASNIIRANDYKLCGDWHIWIEIAKHGNIKISGRVLNYFRKHDADVSGKRFKDGTFHLEFIEIQCLLLKNEIINTYEFKKNLFNKYRIIKKYIPKKGDQRDMIRIYKKQIGFAFYEFKIKTHFTNLYKSIKKIRF